MLPFMRSRNSTKKYNITAFGGINPSYSGAVNELSEGMNMSSEIYPALSSAKGHSVDRSTSNTVSAAGFYNKLYTIEENPEDGKAYICTDNSQTEFTAATEPAVKRTMAFMKDEIFIIPDSVIYYTNTATSKPANVSETTSEESAQEKFTAESLTENDMPMPYNTWYSAYLTGNSIVSMKATYRTTSSTAYTFYHFSVSDSFAVGDVVTVKMNAKPIDATQDSNYFSYTAKMKKGITLKIRELTSTKHTTPSGTVTEYTTITFDDNSIDMGGYDTVFVYGIRVEKGVPNLVDVCSFENRIWGVTTDEICTSKLGDSSEWNDFTVDDYGTLPSSCFSTPVETDGSFTAIIPYNGNIHAFKEDCIHKVYGNEPAEYTVTKINCPGVSADGRDTLAVVGGCLYYKGTEGIYRLSGSTVQLISRNLNIGGLSAVCGGGDERFYFIELYDSKGSYIYVYDTLYGIWHITSAPEGVKAFVRTDTGLKLVCENSIMSMNAADSGEWEFAYSFGKKEFSSKHVCSVSLRYSLAANSNMFVTLKNKHHIRMLAALSGEEKDKPLILRIPVSCSEDSELRFSGNGNFVLSSLSVAYKETGIND